MTKALQKIIALSALLTSALLPQKGGADEMLPQPLPIAPLAGAVSERQTSTVNLKLDFARILTFERPARTIIIGNPGIVDGTLSDENTMVLTGKAVGATNMIVLGEAGEEIANLVVNVMTNNGQLTTVHHGIAQQVYSCAGPCRPLLPPAAK